MYGILFWFLSRCKYFCHLLERCQAVAILVSSSFFEQMNFEQLTLLPTVCLKSFFNEWGSLFWPATRVLRNLTQPWMFWFDEDQMNIKLNVNNFLLSFSQKNYNSFLNFRLILSKYNEKTQRNPTKILRHLLEILRYFTHGKK